MSSEETLRSSWARQVHTCPGEKGKAGEAALLSPCAWATTWSQTSGPGLQGGREQGPQGGGSL